MKKLIGILIYVISFSCCEKKVSLEYPAIIEKNNLNDLYDKAKWEVYKLNCLNLKEWQVDYLVNFADTSLFIKFMKIGAKYREDDKFLVKDKNEMIRIFGEENIRDFLETELELFEKDSSEIYKEGEMYLSFFPKYEKGKYWEKPSGGNCYSIIFKDEEIIRAGCDDYYEFEYSTESQKSIDLEFLELLENKKNLNPWIIQYSNSKYKGQLN